MLTRFAPDKRQTMKNSEPNRNGCSLHAQHRCAVIPQIQVTLNCNLACTYCFQNHCGKIIDFPTVEKIIEKTVSTNETAGCNPDDNALKIYWHGGEPLLAGIDFFRRVVELESRFDGVVFENRIQTNGTLMSDDLAKFFTENRFAVGFSLDGPEDLHNRNRRFRRSGKGSFQATMRGVETYRRHADADRVAVIAVVTRESLDRVDDIFEFFKKIGARVQLDIYDIRCDDLRPNVMAYSKLPELAPSPEEVGKFLIGLFDLWFHDPESKVDFNELRNEVKMILQPEVRRGNPIDKKRCDFRRTIFDPSGTAFSCDQYVNDARTALGNIHTDAMPDILERKSLLWEQIKRRVRKTADQHACCSCEWGAQCIGGCMTCMKYNALLLQARSEGLPDSRWYEAELKPPLKDICGETYYCEGLKTFRRYVKEAVKRELRVQAGPL